MNTSYEYEIWALFDCWNNAIQTGDLEEVMKLYSKDAILVPTISDKVRRTPTEIRDYFEMFLRTKPVSSIEESSIQLHGNIATHAGIYRFRLAANDNKIMKARFSYVYAKQDDGWKIIQHHSSMMPEQFL